MIDVARTNDPRLLELLRSHPKIGAAELSDEPGIQFRQGTWDRKVTVGDFNIEPSGLVELIDNNPMVCADVVSVPDPISTLALIALGPLTLAGLVVERPTVISSMETDDDLVDGFMTTAGWSEGVLTHPELQDIEVRAVTAMAMIANPQDWDDIDDLYEERYSKSFFVRREESVEWEPSLVLGKPWANYRLRYSLGEVNSLLTIQVIADAQGKCGHAQMIHAMNVMAGLEESLGIA